MEPRETLISVQNLNKTFQIREKAVRSIRDTILHFKRLRSQNQQINALQNINFEVRKGQIIGISGKNGSGKSTLINILLGSMRADKGTQIYTAGRIVRFSLGLGFDPDLSARHNIYINGSFLGLSFKGIGLAFADTISLTDLKSFVDTPLKFYSSGMRTRLVFAVAMHALADIFLMDETFGGVGDENFREKSERVFQFTILGDRTIVFVNHNLAQIQFGHKVLLMNKGSRSYLVIAK